MKRLIVCLLLAGCARVETPQEYTARIVNERVNTAELHLAERLERIEANQQALMLRFGFKPEVKP